LFLPLNLLIKKENKMRELLRNFQSRCTVIGPDRNLVLTKLLSAGIAYATQVPYGELEDMRISYEKCVINPAIKVISEVNEVLVINTEEVLKEVKCLWEARYKVLNTPIATTDVYDHLAVLRSATRDFVEVYNYWVLDFQRASFDLIARGV
jgi:hypothetical protein